MSAQVKYAYLKDQTWLYRRNYPREVAAVLGRQSLKQSLKTSDIKTARVRAAELNTQYEETVTSVLEGATSGTRVDDSGSAWLTPSELARLRLRATLAHSGGPSFGGTATPDAWTVKEASRRYLVRRQRELRPSGFKSVRYSVELFASAHPEVPLTELTRDHGRQFLSDIAELSPLLGKAEATRQLSLEQALRWSRLRKGTITARTQRRIWSQVTHWLDWCVYEDQLEVNPFKVVRFERKVRYRPYEVPTDEEVSRLVGHDDPEIGRLLLVCLLSGMRSGEATGLLREDIVDRGSAGRFFHVQPNELRLLKTEAAERLVPVHGVLERVLAALPSEGPLFPSLSVNDVTKRFAHLRSALDIERPGLVFHSTRKWFITQCERTGVPEHWTASLVGHKSARSENGITYSIYSAGISDEQKRGIVDSIRLPDS